MIRKLSSKKKFFLVSCSDWETVTLSESKELAAVEGMRLAYDRLGKSMNLSSVVVVSDISELEKSDAYNPEIFDAPAVLLDAGQNELSSQLTTILRKNHF